MRSFRAAAGAILALPLFAAPVPARAPIAAGAWSVSTRLSPAMPFLLPSFEVFSPSLCVQTHTPLLMMLPHDLPQLIG